MNIRQIVINGVFLTTLAASVVGTSKNNDLEQILKEPVISVDYNSEALSRTIIPIKKNSKSIETLELLNEFKQIYANSFYDNSQFRMTDSIAQVLDVDYFMNLMYSESANNPDTTSYVGAAGLGQFLKPAWDMVDKENSYDVFVFEPRTNMRNMGRYNVFLYQFLEKKHPNWENLSKNEKQDQIRAAYNAGHGLLQKRNFDITIMPTETKLYVKRQQHKFPVLVNSDLYSQIMDDAEKFRELMMDVDYTLDAPLISDKNISANDIELGKLSVNYK